MGNWVDEGPKLKNIDEVIDFLKGHLDVISVKLSGKKRDVRQWSD